MARSFLNPRTWFKSRTETKQNQAREDRVPAISPGRVSAPDDGWSNTTLMAALRGMTTLVTPSFRMELIPIIRDLYKINPDVSIALQDMFKLANTGHTISFPNNTPEEAERMREHLSKVTVNWSRYTAGIDGLVNKMIVQCLVGGAISVEAVPKSDLSGIATLVFIKPETIRFQRKKNGVYAPYQKNPRPVENKKPDYIKLNPETYFYVAQYNDTDEPYGVPPFLGALDSLKGQHDMRENFKHIMELMGMVGFLEAKMEKPTRRASESEKAYETRLQSTLKRLKTNLMGSLRDGVVVGYKDDHEFKMNSTTHTLENLDKPWSMNQQSVANGLGVNGNLIGVQTNTTEGGTGVLLSKMISQLKNIQMLVKFVLEKVYNLELRLAGLPNKGIKVTFGTSTISDELKVQQGQEYKIKNLQTLYAQGIISQEQFAWEMGYESPAEKEPREEYIDPGTTPVAKDISDAKREAGKDASDRKGRDKSNPTPKRHDQDSRKR